MKPLTLLSLIILTLLSGAAQAQPVWTFDQVLQSALVSHPVMLGRRAAQSAAQADRQGAEWQRYPTPSIEAATQSSGGNVGLLRLEQPLWSGGRITANIDAAGSRLDAAGAALDEARLELSLRVIAAYTEALRQRAKQQHAKTSVEEHDKLLAMIRRRVTQEVSTLTDQRLAESRLYQSANDLSAVTQALNNALTQLAQLAGRAVAEISEQGVNDRGAPAGLDAAMARALEWSPALRRLTHEEEAANADITVKRSAYLPQLALRLERSVGQVQDSRAMLVLQAQPGAGLSSVSGVEAAIARREAARMARDTAERDLRERVTLDWNERVAARQRVENANLARAMSTEVFESYARQYVIGRKTWIDVLNAVREAALSQFALEDARIQVIAASLRLRAQTGTLMPDEGLKP